ncbi:MAG: restriction endonuclease subunit S [Proteobacteria bacterium]|nr:restriction endonuclease subunit S [Pseudomonadota bacterium]
MSEPLRLPPEWSWGTLGSLAQGVRGVAYRPEDLRNSNASDVCNLLRSTNIQNGQVVYEDLQYVPHSIVKPSQVAAPGDLAVCMSNGSRNLVGKSAQIGPEARYKRITVGAFCSLFKPHPGVPASFVKQIFSSAFFSKLVDFTLAGSAINNLKNSDIESFPVPLPPAPEQEGIAEVLSALDEQTEATLALIDKLTLRRKGLVQELLLPVAHASETVALGSVCSVITSGSRGWAQYYAPEGDLFLRIGNLTRAHPNLRFEDVVWVKPPSGGEGLRTRLEAGDVLISITADLGIIGCIPENLGPAYINQHIALARINSPELAPRWVAHVLASPFGFEQIAKLNDGGAKAGLNLPTVQALLIPKPSLETQKELAALLDSADAEIAAEQELAEKLRLQKDGLMHDLLTGKTRVTTKLEALQ